MPASVASASFSKACASSAISRAIRRPRFRARVPAWARNAAASHSAVSSSTMPVGRSAQTTKSTGRDEPALPGRVGLRHRAVEPEERLGLPARGDAVRQDVALEPPHVAEADAVLRQDLVGEVGRKILSHLLTPPRPLLDAGVPVCRDLATGAGSGRLMAKSESRFR